MQYAATVLGIFFPQDRQRVFTRITGMHDYRFVQIATDADMLTKRGLLQFKIVFLIEIIQTGFPQRHHLLCRR
ncbi:hypothetical protein D3C78_1689860 [compost metagenome]